MKKSMLCNFYKYNNIILQTDYELLIIICISLCKSLQNIYFIPRERIIDSKLYLLEIVLCRREYNKHLY
jgi:hypothetical protein